jgi:hypothetical protein
MGTDLHQRTGRNRTSDLALLSLVFVTVSVPMRATTLVHMSLEQLSQAASDVVRGQVIDQTSSWDASHKLIRTVTRVAVERRMKGQAPDLIEVEQPGGKIGNLRVYVPGTVHLLPGAKYLLFVEPAQAIPSQYLVVGMAQGAYRIYRDAVTGQERVIRPLGRMFYGPGAGPPQTESLKVFGEELSDAITTPIAVPAGTLMLVRIDAAEMSGVGRLEVQGRTARDLFPSAKVAIPAGSVVEGTAQETSDTWQIRWSDIIVRGKRIPISGASSEPIGTLRGRILVVRVR